MRAFAGQPSYGLGELVIASFCSWSPLGIKALTVFRWTLLITTKCLGLT